MYVKKSRSKIDPYELSRISVLDELIKEPKLSFQATSATRIARWPLPKPNYLEMVKDNLKNFAWTGFKTVRPFRSGSGK